MPQCSLISGGSRGGARGLASSPLILGKIKPLPPPLAQELDPPLLMSMGSPFFISKLKFSYDKYSVGEV